MAKTWAEAYGAASKEAIRAKTEAGQATRRGWMPPEGTFPCEVTDKYISNFTDDETKEVHILVTLKLTILDGPQDLLGASFMHSFRTSNEFDMGAMFDIASNVVGENIGPKASSGSVVTPEDYQAATERLGNFFDGALILSTKWNVKVEAGKKNKDRRFSRVQGRIREPEAVG